MEIVICPFAGLFLLASGWSKLRDIEAFRAIVLQYPLPAVTGRAGLAWIVPLVEVLLGLSLLSLREPWAGWGAAGGGLFVVVVSAAVIARTLRGERRFQCGCEGDLSQFHSAGWILLRNFCLLLILSRVVAKGLPAGAGVHIVPAYLAGAGLMAVLKLAEATHIARRAILEWKVPG